VNDAKAVPPPINLVLNCLELASLRQQVNDATLVKIIREEVRQWKPRAISIQDAAAQVATAAAERARSILLAPRALLNATGIIIHTGWGNAPLHITARERLLDACGATPTGAAGTPPRTETCAKLLCTLTGAEAATITTQNAASLLLVAGALAAGREIVVAARDLVEISQKARIADILQSAGARVVAVGSANCVNIDDFQRAITPQTAMLMRSHVSNVASVGYLEHVTTRQLVELGRASGLMYVENLGGGSLVDLEKQGLPWCPTLEQAIAGGADLVLASGDKIIGGPQAGIVVGKKEWVQKLSQHTLARACRCSKLTLAAMEATLAVYLTGRAWKEMPTLRLLGMPAGALQRRATEVANACNASDGLRATLQKDSTECGGAVLPGVLLPTWTVRLRHHNLTEDELRGALLAHGTVARRGEGDVILDLRSILPEDDALLLESVRSSCMAQAAGAQNAIADS
jgi:L-seryl-tRNA(Ser) seleniumtransferase